MSGFLPWWARWLALVALITASAAFGAYKMHSHDQARYDVLAAEKAAFEAKVAALGGQAKAAAVAREVQDKERKGRVDRENRKTVADLHSTITRLRDDADRARRGTLPAAPAGSSRPDLLCLDRAEYQRADGEATARLRQGARGLADEGTAATVDLNSARKWAKEL